VARKFEKLAKSAFFQARKSVKDAEARHKAASEHIINVDSDEDDESVGDGDKKPAAIPTVTRGSNERAAAPSSQAGAQSKRRTVQSTPESRALKIEITGCGTQEVNGTYVRFTSFTNIAPVFSRKGEWKGKPRWFYLERTVKGNWVIEIRTGRLFYTTTLDSDPVTGESLHPFNKNWITRGPRVLPPPTLSVVSYDRF
jgi:hypothetical protein